MSLKCYTFLVRPPRVPVFLSDEKPVIYFLTLCTKGRVRTLAFAEVFESILRVLDGLDRWKVWAITAMPDHLHILVSPPKRETSVGDFSKLFKVGLRKLNPPIEWQEGCFDHLLRSHESSQQKWKYMRENPVRAGLVKDWEDWPFQKGFYENR